MFEVVAGSGQVTTLATFDGTNGENPVGSLAVDSSGDLYGATFQGGNGNNDGVIFEVTDSGFVVPEPASIMLLSVAAMVLPGRRRMRQVAAMKAYKSGRIF